MRTVDIIASKRDGNALDTEQIRWFIRAFTDGEVPDYQAAALLMAIFFRGMEPAELAAWADAMLRSGDVLDLSAIPGRKVDKHSTGGVGDAVSLVLAPLVAACGVPVPMISGRGLGHTGGTLDKLESIPGFRTNLDADTFAAQVASLGCCLIGQTEQIAPADRRMYALRDVTATVECIPLIASSIMSKKLAEGIDALVLDVKVGTGAFMKTHGDARLLAQTMIQIGRSAGREVVAMLTDMDVPLARSVGNSLEVIECCEILRNKLTTGALRELSLEQAAWMLVLGGVADDVKAGRAMAEATLASGAAFARFEQIVAAQYGDPAALSDYSRLPGARHQAELRASRAGFVTGFHCADVGRAAMMLGAGRATKDDVVDPGAGIVLVEAERGRQVEEGALLATLHFNDPERVGAAIALLEASIQIGDEVPAPTPLIFELLGVD